MTAEQLKPPIPDISVTRREVAYIPAVGLGKLIPKTDRSAEVPVQNSEQLAEKLVSAYRARVSFDQVTTRALKTSEDSIDSELERVAHSRIEGGLSAESIINIFSAKMETAKPHEKPYISDHIRRVSIHSGDFDVADRLREERDHIDRSELIDSARKKARLGLDPWQELQAYLDELTKYETEFHYGHAKEYAELAVILYETTGKDPTPFLEKSQQHLKEYIKEYGNDPSYAPNAFEALSKAYAFFGDFKKAEQLRKKIRGPKEYHIEFLRMRAAMCIGEEQAKRNLYTDAIKSAHLALGEIDRMPSGHDKTHHYSIEGAKVYAFIGKMLFFLGEDYNSAFLLSKERAKRQSPSLWTMDTLMYLAKIKKDLNIEYTDELKEALQTLDDISLDPKYSDQKFGIYLISEQEIGYEELIEKLVQLGHIKEAEHVFSRLQQHPLSQDMPEGICISAQSHIASGLARQGLTQKEIEGLSRQQIAALLKTGDPQILEALTYFDLLPRPGVARRGILFRRKQ